jgi:Zn-dependent protease with chaperone function
MKLKRILATLLIVLCVPAFAGGVFWYASHHQTKMIREAFLTELSKAKDLDPKVKADWESFLSKADFAAVCRKSTPQDAEFVKRFQLERECDSYAPYRWGIYTALGYVGWLVIFGFLMATSLLLARSSATRLIGSYRMAWVLTVFTCVITLLVIGTLGVASLYEATVVTIQRYYPQLLAGLAIGALLAMFRVTQTIFKKSPLEFGQGDAQSVSQAEAPLLWNTVEALSRRVEIDPPTEILVGSELNFFVTELSVIHLGGKTKGRTLYLSSRLMKILDTGEVEAVIGHELAHFKGQDTKLTKEFYPFRWKIGQTIGHLHQARAVAIPALVIVGAFNDLFEVVIAKYSRIRELAADALGASVTSPQAMGRALVKLSLHSEAFSSSYRRAIETGNPNLPEERTMFEQYLKGGNAWSKIEESRLPHPIDSHPPLSERLASLGCSLAELNGQISPVITDSASDAWFTKDSKAIQQVEKRHHELVEESVKLSSVKFLQSDSEDARALIEKTWPRKEWRPSKAGAIFSGMFAIVAIGAVVCALTGAFLQQVIPMVLAWSLAACVFGLCLWLGWKRYTRIRNAALFLTHTGIWLNRWNRKIAFGEIAKLHAVVHNGVCTMTIYLGQKIEHPEKPTKQAAKLNINLSWFGDYNTIYGTIYQYWQQRVAVLQGKAESKASLMQ